MLSRYERKFLAAGVGTAGVVSHVMRHPAVFRETYPPRVVTSVYLDTSGLTDYHDHVNGAPSRSKTRLRWYGPPRHDVEAVALERKTRRGAIGWKQVFALGPVCVAPRDGGGALWSAVDRAPLPEFVRVALPLLRPSAGSRYLRRYFETSDRRFRLTVDEGLEVLLPRQAFDVRGRGLRFDGLVIVELKFAPGDAEEGSEVAARLPFRLGRFSKYIAGIEALRAP